MAFSLGCLGLCSSEQDGDDPGECSDGVGNDLNSALECDDEGCIRSPDCHGAASEAPEDTDADADADADTGSGGWLEDAGTYLGTTAVTLWIPTGEVSCEDGLFELNIDRNGDALGWAGCADQRSPGTGAIAGLVGQGVFEGAWYVEFMMGRHQLPMPLAGTVADGHVLLELRHEDDMVFLDARMDGWRQE